MLLQFRLAKHAAFGKVNLQASCPANLEATRLPSSLLDHLLIDNRRIIHGPDLIRHVIAHLVADHFEFPGVEPGYQQLSQRVGSPECGLRVHGVGIERLIAANPFMPRMWAWWREYGEQMQAADVLPYAELYQVLERRRIDRLQ